MNIQRLLLAFCLLCAHMSFAQSVHYVKPGNTGTGASWANASGDIQAMINASVAGDQIWVAAGTYKPNRRADAVTVITPTHPYNAFVLKAGVKLYGGFAGTETTLTARNWTANRSILSGDIRVNNNDPKCYHVVISSGNAVVGTDTAKIDGFTVRDGRADLNSFGTTVNGLSVEFNIGAGIYNVGDATSSAPVIANCVISNDTALISGGGIFNSYASPTIINCIISNNVALADYAGGIGNDHANPIISHCIIVNNIGTNGGGINNNASLPVITNCNISGNTARGSGGGIYSCCASFPVIVNCQITADTADYGGGIYNLNSSATITNCTIADNTGSTTAGGIYTNNGSNATLFLNNSIVWGNSSGIVNAGHNAVAIYSVVQGGYAGVGNSSSDPLFTNAATGNYRLQTGSPAIDLGNNAAYTSVGNINTDKDLANHPRLTGTTIDMGAFEVCTMTTGTDVIIACGSYTWINGLTYTASNNTATDTLISATGCDSVATLNLTIHPRPNISVTTNAATATVAQANANYQWINCTTGQAITGATSQSFTATIGGIYKVVVSLNNCFDTSSCVNLTPTGIKEIDWSNAISIAPNPARDRVTISFNGLDAGNLSISIVDVQGKVVFHSEATVSSVSYKTTLDLHKVPKGFYLVKFNAGNEFGVKKLIVQ